MSVDGNNVWTHNAKNRKCVDTQTAFPVQNDHGANATDLIDNCEVYSRYLGQANKLTCVKCKTGYLPAMKYTDNITTLIREDLTV